MLLPSSSPWASERGSLGFLVRKMVEKLPDNIAPQNKSGIFINVPETVAGTVVLLAHRLNPAGIP